MAEHDPALARLWLLSLVRLAGVGLAILGVLAAGRSDGAVAGIATGLVLMLAGAGLVLLAPRALARWWRR